MYVCRNYLCRSEEKVWFLETIDFGFGGSLTWVLEIELWSPTRVNSRNRQLHCSSPFLTIPINSPDISLGRSRGLGDLRAQHLITNLK